MVRLILIGGVLCTLLLCGGCGIGGKSLSLMEAIQTGRVKGLDPADRFRWGWPEYAQQKQFVEVSAVPYSLWGGPNEGAAVYAILGKHKKTGEWELIYLSKRTAKGWVRLEVAESADPAPVARSLPSP